MRRETEVSRTSIRSKKKMFAETTNVFPGCFRLSARRVDMLREFHLALAGRGEVNGSNASRDGNGGFREAQMCRSNVDGFKHICTAISVPWRIPVRFKGTKFTSRPDRVPARRSLGPGGDRRVPQPRDERLMNLAHRCSCFAGDICGRCFSSLGGGCARRLRGSVPFPQPRPQFLSNRLKSSWRGGTSSRGVPRASRTPRTVSCDPPRTRSPPRRRDTSTCTTR